jgi:hypothetical protein
MIARWSTDVDSVHWSKTLQFRLFFPKIKTLPTHATAISPQQPTESQAKKRTPYTTIILSK